MSKGKLDDSHAVELEPGLFWLGFADYEAGFSNNPYLLLDDDQAILFDPGPGHPVFRDMIIQKIQEIAAPSIIRYIVVHHQDPDLCGLIPYLEDFLHPEVCIIAHPRTGLFLPYYGMRKPILPVGDGDSLRLKSGRILEFHHTPYVHFAGSMVSFLPERGILFSSDIFGVFDREWSLYATKDYPRLAREFLEHYVCSKDALIYAYKKFKSLDIRKILPQHGGVIEKDIERFLEVLREAEPGVLIRELENKPNEGQLRLLLESASAWTREWMGSRIEFSDLTKLKAFVLERGPATVSLLFDLLTREAARIGVANPLTLGQIHEWERPEGAAANPLVDNYRKRLLSAQYSILHGTESNADMLIQRRFNALKARLAILFVDIRGFTKWSSDRSPDEVIGMLNKEEGSIIRAINASGGRVNKSMGDGILAYFTESRLPECLFACLKIQREIKMAGLLPSGVGVDLGEVIMGDIGEELRVDFTIIGNAVNQASRFCDCAAGGQIVLGRDFFDALPEQTREALASMPDFEEITVRRKPQDPERQALRFRAAAD